jgi:hypothetical protein
MDRLSIDIYMNNLSRDKSISINFRRLNGPQTIYFSQILLAFTAPS